MDDWSIFVDSEKLKIFQKYIGEIRFGPEYIALKSNPAIDFFNNKVFGNWFYQSQKGVFLQEWNSLQKANTNLIFVHFDKLQFFIVQKNIKSVLWDMKETADSFLLNLNPNHLELKIDKRILE